MHFLIGLLLVAAIIYVAFVRKKDDDNETTIKKIAITAVVLFVVGCLALYILSGVLHLF
jgi:ABC-type Co2+ transport system permease subunit